ncbi:MAG: hypothetical protein ABR880_16330 [Candidatus Sulfotelmatobacter sp.]|jgi:hypothetical protein
MSPRNAIVLLLALSTLLFLAACGSNNGITNPTPPPSGGFTNANLDGTYVFSVSGTDQASALPYAITGTFTANGSGGNGKGTITGGTFDINDADTTEFTSGPIADASINSNSFYNVSVDGRGQATIGSNISGFPNLTFDFVLSSSSHGLITEFDSFGTGSGTLDLQSSGVTPSGAYAFSFSGGTYSGAPFATVGNFTLGSGGAITAGLADFNNGALTISAGQTLAGTVVVASTPSTTLSTAQYPSLAFDVFPIDANHLKFIETDGNGTLSGDAFSQTTATLPSGTLAFTLQGSLATGAPVAAGGFMVTDSTGDITSSSTEDFNEGGTLSPATPVPFTASYVAGGTGRYTISNFSGFTPAGLTYAAYPSSGGTLLLEIDTVGVTAGAAYTQTSTATFASASQGFGLSLSGDNLSSSGIDPVGDIAEFTAAPSGSTVTGLIDENYYTATSPFFDQVLAGTYGSIDTGRSGITATTGTSTSPGTLNGGFALTLYTVDGTTFPFIESDSGQVSAGVIVAQSSPSSSAAVAHSNMFVARPMFHPHAARQKKN